MKESDNNGDMHEHWTSVELSHKEFVHQKRGKELSRNKVIKSLIFQQKKIQIYLVKNDSEIQKII